MRRFKLINETVRDLASHAVRDAPAGWEVIVRESRRNLDQNAAQWPILEAFSLQLNWPVNGHMTRMSAEEWKDVLTAAFEKERRVAEGLNGGHVFIGQRTSYYSKARFSEWLDFLHSVASERGVEL